MDIVISARVPEDALQILKDNHTNVSEIVRASVIEAAQQQKLKDAKEALKSMAGIMKKIEKDKFVQIIRGDRDAAH